MEPNEHSPEKFDNEPAAVRRNFLRLARYVFLFLFLWLVAAYLIIPLAWHLFGRHHPSLEDVPRITVTKHGIRGDPINIAIVGTDEEVVKAMLNSDWLPADPITIRSSLRIASRTIRSRPYETAPVSDLFVWGRKQDLSFQQSIGKNPRKRHHVRFWRSEEIDDNGRPLWIGAATLDISVGFSRTTAQITHHIDADVDAERNKLLDDLKKGKEILSVDWMNKFHTQLQSRNGGGDRWLTDGRLPIVVLKPAPLTHPEP